MSTAINKAGKKLFARHLEQYTPTDPLYEEYVDKRGRTKRRKRQLPPGLSDRDAAILRSVKRRAHHLDKGFNLCGFRFGWSFIIGIIPIAGDAADVILGYYFVIRKARRAEIPAWLTQRMIFNLALATSVGLVPIVGDVLLAAFRANSRNAALLEEFLRLRGEGVSRTAADETTSTPLVDKRIGASRDVAAHEETTAAAAAGQDAADDRELVHLDTKRRSWLFRGGPPHANADDKGASTSALPDDPHVLQHRDSRFIEDVY